MTDCGICNRPLGVHSIEQLTICVGKSITRLKADLRTADKIEKEMAKWRRDK